MCALMKIEHLWVEVNHSEMETHYECLRCKAKLTEDHLGFSLEFLINHYPEHKYC